jgi:hypothetical protein
VVSLLDIQPPHPTCTIQTTSICVPALVTGSRDERVRVMAGLNKNLGITRDVEASLTSAGELQIPCILSGSEAPRIKSREIICWRVVRKASAYN